MDENSVIKEFIAATGLPTDMVQALLNQLMEECNINPQDVTLEDLRKITETYLFEVFSEVAS